MKFVIRHITLFSRATLLAFVLASSGFTAVLRTCAMEAMSCCEELQASDYMGCETEQPVDAPTVSLRADVQCHANILVGGVTTNPAVVEKDHKYQQTRLSIAADVIPLHWLQTSSPSVSSLSIYTTTIISPPSVEKYVLNASFLI